MLWTAPATMTAAQAFRFCARRAMLAHKAGQSSVARFWFERAEVFAGMAAS